MDNDRAISTGYIFGNRPSTEKCRAILFAESHFDTRISDRDIEESQARLLAVTHRQYSIESNDGRRHDTCDYKDDGE